jgi:hypothetical protein
MLQAYVINISYVSDIYYSKCFMLQVFYDQVQEGSTSRGGPLGHNGPCVHAGSKAGVV